jgi:hypothetical protein
MYLDTTRKGLPPSEEEIQSAWSRVEFPILPTKLDQHPLIAAYREVYSAYEGVVFLQIKGPTDPAICWYASRNRLPEIGFFGKLLRSPSIVTHPYLELDLSSITEPSFEFTSGFCLGGLLAADLFYGGTVRQYSDSAKAAKDLGELFCKSLAENRFDELTVYWTREPWASWYHEYGADRTYIILDRRTTTISLLLLTDSA